ncbi:hypothetical protein AB9K35_04790 [Leisingera sp. XS_AS12]|uniref:hypothetical protein n=1 Tax=Leisingera sp. XS_AS12 TaxID=3241294 RepID=UPI0035115A93
MGGHHDLQGGSAGKDCACKAARATLLKSCLFDQLHQSYLEFFGLIARRRAGLTLGAERGKCKSARRILREAALP